MTNSRPFSELTCGFSAERRARIDAIRERIGAQLVSEIIELIADEVESRGDRKLDLDPGETSEWLRTFLNDRVVDRSGRMS